MHRLLGFAVLFCGAIHADTTLVLPFFNHSASPNLEWIGESIAETVHDALASEGVLVLDRVDRLEAYRRLSLRPGAELTRASILKIGESLDATNVIYGSYELTQGGDGAVEGLDPHRGAHPQSEEDAPGADGQRDGGARGSRGAGGAAGMAGAGVAAGEVGAAARRSSCGRARRCGSTRWRVMSAGCWARPPSSGIVSSRRRRGSTSKYSQPCFQLGMIYWERKDYKVAISWLERVDAHRPALPRSEVLPRPLEVTIAAISPAPRSRSSWWPPRCR